VRYGARPFATFIYDISSIPLMSLPLCEYSKGQSLGIPTPQVVVVVVVGLDVIKVRSLSVTISNGVLWGDLSVQIVGC
jgi:hypothetical protein